MNSIDLHDVARALSDLRAARPLVHNITNYVAMTHVNFYARWWGELLLGDIQDNVLAVVKQRAEARHATAG